MSLSCTHARSRSPSLYLAVSLSLSLADPVLGFLETYWVPRATRHSHDPATRRPNLDSVTVITGRAHSMPRSLSESSSAGACRCIFWKPLFLAQTCPITTPTPLGKWPHPLHQKPFISTRFFMFYRVWVMKWAVVVVVVVSSLIQLNPRAWNVSRPWKELQAI